MSNTEWEGEGERHETGFELEEVSLQNHEIQSPTLLLPGHLSIHLPDSLWLSMVASCQLFACSDSTC